MTARIAALEDAIAERFARAFSRSLWRSGELVRRIDSSGDLSAFASLIAAQRFPAAPLIRNELINRDGLSSNLVAARRELMTAMLSHESEENLGFTGFPPEYALYLSMLKSLHVKENGAWRFVTAETGAPNASDVQYGRLWELTARRLEESEVLTLSELYAFWRRAPFGLRRGPMPVLALAFLLANRGRIALYENRAFTPEISLAILDEWLAAPDRIAFRMVKADAGSDLLVARLAESMPKFSGEPCEATPLGVARAIVAAVLRSPKWAQHSTSFSPATQRFKQTVLKASDPMRLLFEDAPAVFGVKDPETLARAIDAALSEYLAAMPVLIERMRGMLMRAIKAEPDDAGAPDAARIRARAAAVRGLGGRLILNAFVARLEKYSGARSDIEALVGLACAKPQFQWTDADMLVAETKLSELGFEFRELEATASLRGRSVRSRMLRVVAAGAEADADRRIELTGREAGEAAALADRLRKLLGGADPRIALAALADAGSTLAFPAAEKDSKEASR